MMLLPFVKPQVPIGLDVGSRFVKAVQLAPQGSHQQLVAAAMIERAPSAGTMTGQEAQALRKKLGSLGFVGNRLALAVPEEKLLSGIMELPPASSGAPIEALARSELARMHKCEPQSFEMTSWTLPAPARAANTTFVMGAACCHADANSLLDSFENEGFCVESLETQSQALARALTPVLVGKGNLTGVLDLGWATPRLVLLYEDVVVYERRLTRSAYGNVVADVAKLLGMASEEAETLLAGGDEKSHSEPITDICRDYAKKLAEEMRMPLTYVSNQYPDATAEQLLLVGGGATLPGIDKMLTEEVGVPAKIVTLTDLFECPPETTRFQGPALVTASGLAWALEDSTR